MEQLNTEPTKTTATAKKPFRMSVLVCAGTGCVSSNSFKVMEALRDEIKKHNLEKEIQIEAKNLLELIKEQSFQNIIQAL